VNFEEFIDEWVTFGRRVDESGFWTGHVRLGLGYEIFKLKRRGKILPRGSHGRNQRLRLLGNSVVRC